MGRLTFFGYHDNKSDKSLETMATALTLDTSTSIDLNNEYVYQDELLSNNTKQSLADNSQKLPTRQFALVQFEKPVTCQNNCLVIGSKLDTDIHANMCRIAFHGKLLEGFTDSKYAETALPKLKVYKVKHVVFFNTFFVRMCLSEVQINVAELKKIII